jgi:electron transport complex protein RnfB
VEPCPVDCIDLISEETTAQTWHWDLPPPDTAPVIIASDKLLDDEEQAA